MLIIDPDRHETYDFKFSPAICRSKNCAAYRVSEPFQLGDQEGLPGDWLVRENGKLRLVHHRHFVTEFTTAEHRQASDKKRLPKVKDGDVGDATLIKLGRRGHTEIRKQPDTATYFIDDRDNLNNRDEAPYAYLSLHCPFTERGTTSGAYVEDVIDILIDHIWGSRIKTNAAKVDQVLYHLYEAQMLLARFGVGVVNVREDRIKKIPGEDVAPGEKGCCK